MRQAAGQVVMTFPFSLPTRLAWQISAGEASHELFYRQIKVIGDRFEFTASRSIELICYGARFCEHDQSDLLLTDEHVT